MAEVVDLWRASSDDEAPPSTRVQLNRRASRSRATTTRASPRRAGPQRASGRTTTTTTRTSWRSSAAAAGRRRRPRAPPRSHRCDGNPRHRRETAAVRRRRRPHREPAAAARRRREAPPLAAATAPTLPQPITPAREHGLASRWPDAFSGAFTTAAVNPDAPPANAFRRALRADPRASSSTARARALRHCLCVIDARDGRDAAVPHEQRLAQILMIPARCARWSVRSIDRSGPTPS